VREAVQEETAMKVRDIMTSAFVSCQKETDIGTAARLMLEGRFGTLPVVDTQGRLVGIITDRDIAMAAATRQRNA
jgi:acetoin utilization protein AcuB